MLSEISPRLNIELFVSLGFDTSCSGLIFHFRWHLTPCTGGLPRLCPAESGPVDLQSLRNVKGSHNAFANFWKYPLFIGLLATTTPPVEKSTQSVGACLPEMSQRWLLMCLEDVIEAAMSRILLDDEVLQIQDAPALQKLLVADCRRLVGKHMPLALMPVLPVDTVLVSCCGQLSLLKFPLTWLPEVLHAPSNRRGSNGPFNEVTDQ